MNELNELNELEGDFWIPGWKEGNWLNLLTILTYSRPDLHWYGSQSIDSHRFYMTVILDR